MNNQQVFLEDVEGKIIDLKVMLEQAETTLHIVLEEYFRTTPHEENVEVKILHDHAKASVLSEITGDILFKMRNTFSEITNLLEGSDTQ
ncbi:hypothetical protein ACQKL5_21195 [Peribacillus sp. NPDC097675]|uniref:hypothetical protein n=1 Tax=Peribacillus sp. NPDC097675 TaxID=3390618 RepID=UPI003D075406